MRSTKPTPTWWSTATTTTTSAWPPKPRKAPLIRLVAFVNFVVGTGGKGLRPFSAPKPNSEAGNAEAFGVLKLTLHANGYDWQFIPEEGKSYTDSGSGACH